MSPQAFTAAPTPAISLALPTTGDGGTLTPVMMPQDLYTIVGSVLGVAAIQALPAVTPVKALKF